MLSHDVYWKINTWWHHNTQTAFKFLAYWPNYLRPNQRTVTWLVSEEYPCSTTSVILNFKKYTELTMSLIRLFFFFFLKGTQCQWIKYSIFLQEGIETPLDPQVKAYEYIYNWVPVKVTDLKFKYLIFPVNISTSEVTGRKKKKADATRKEMTVWLYYLVFLQCVLFNALLPASLK